MSTFNQRTSHRVGFTLIEILVSISIIAVLISISVPALRHARSAARTSVSLSNIRQVYHALDTYASAYKGSFPYAPAGTWFALSPPNSTSGSSSIKTGRHWDVTRFWPSLLHETSPWREHFRAWVAPGAPVDPDRPWEREAELGTTSGTPSYYMTHSCVARPQLWTGTEATSTGGTGLGIDISGFLKPVRMNEVRFTSAKVIVYGWETPGSLRVGGDRGGRDRREMLFGDGHAALKLRSQATPPFSAPGKGVPRPLDDTPDGIYGRDY